MNKYPKMCYCFGGGRGGFKTYRGDISPLKGLKNITEPNYLNMKWNIGNTFGSCSCIEPRALNCS